MSRKSRDLTKRELDSLRRRALTREELERLGTVLTQATNLRQGGDRRQAPQTSPPQSSSRSAFWPSPASAAAGSSAAHPEDCVCPGPKDRRKPYRAINAARDSSGEPPTYPWSAAATSTPSASLGSHVHNGRYAAPLLGHCYQQRSITERYIHENSEALRPSADTIAGAIGKALGLADQGRVVAFYAH